MTDSLFIMGKPGARDVLVWHSQEVEFVTPAGGVRADAFAADLAPELRVRRHPDGGHLFAILVMGRQVAGGKPPVAMFAPVTPHELEALARQATAAAVAVRKNNAQVDPYHGVGMRREMTEEYKLFLRQQGIDPGVVA